MLELKMLMRKNEIRINIVLLGINWYRPKDPRTPLGLAMIGAYLLDHVKFQKGKSLHFLNYDVRENLSDALHEILEINPKILGIGVYVWNINEIKQIISGLRKLGYSGIIVLGGPEITYGDYKLKTEFPEVDYFVKGDGEQAFLNIVLYEMKFNKTLSEGIFTQESTDFNSFARINDFDFISPFQNHKIREIILGNNKERFIRWQTQRGCKYKCAYCAFPNGHHKVIEMDLKKIEEDLKYFASREVKEVAVLDPIFFVHKERAMKILNLIEHICPNIRFEIQTRIEHLDDELLDKISRMGNIVLECGIQTLDNAVQREIRRVYQKNKIKEKLKKIKEYNIEFELHLIYGLPKQTFDSFLKDYKFLKQYTDNIKLFPLIRLRGTVLDHSIKDDNNDMIFSPIFPKEVIRTKWMDQNTILKIKKYGSKYLDQTLNHNSLPKDMEKITVGK